MSHVPTKLVYRPIGTEGEPWPEWVRYLDGVSGVYVIREKHGDKIVYVGSSKGRLYDTITRHFQNWKRAKKFWTGMRGAGHDPGMVYKRNAHTIAVKTTDKGEALETEADLIARLKPRDNLVARPDGGDDDTVPF